MSTTSHHTSSPAGEVEVTEPRPAIIRTPSRSSMAWTTRSTPGALALVERSVPRAGEGELLVRVEACALCRTDLHVLDQELPVHRPHVVPGHQIVGTVVGVGPAVHTLRPGARVGAAWLRRTCGVCRWCRDGRENLCAAAQFTGWDADGGFADYAVVPEAFAYALPRSADAATVAPLLCAGIIGYRALTRSNLPAGGRLGIYGFGSSAHITAELAISAGARVYAMTRGESSRRLARDIGAVFVGDTSAVPPEKLDAAIVFAPAGDLVPGALRATDRGGTVVLAGIHMSDIPSMSYDDHLFLERDLRTVTANTRADGEAFLRLADSLGLTPTVSRFPFERLPEAVAQLRAGTVAGSLVIEPRVD